MKHLSLLALALMQGLESVEKLLVFLPLMQDTLHTFISTFL